MKSFLNHPYIRNLLSLELPLTDYAIAGSGPLFARGWIDDPTDIDVVARGAAWDAAVRIVAPEPAPYPPVQRVVLFGGTIEVLDGWFPDRWSVDDLIDGADIIEHIRFVKLDVVADTKKMLGRVRDLEHLVVLDAHGWSPSSGDS